MIIFILNNCNFHFEIIESIIIQYPIIIGKKLNNPIIYLSFKQNKSFLSYIEKKYPYIKIGIPKKYDYFINCTIYTRSKFFIKKDRRHFYISHEFDSSLLPFPNIFFVFPKIKERYLSLHYLPFHNCKKKTSEPIFIIQGNLNHKFRRNFFLLETILKEKYSYPFKIKLIGSGSLPTNLNPYKDKIILKNNLNFEDFHKEFLDGYAILPLISKEKQKHYYTFKLTSTINYAKAYNLQCIMDYDLYQIYPLENVEIYNNDKDITYAFQKSLQNFYHKN